MTHGKDARSRGADEARIDVFRLFAAIGEAPYEWRIGSDQLAWSDNACAVLGIADPSLIATGRDFARLLHPDNSLGRFDAIMGREARDEGAGVPYALQYRLRAPTDDGEGTWLEDVGRWYAGPDGRPAFAHGVVRAINERRAREERLAYLSQFDETTGEMNRFHLIESLEAVIEDAIRCRTSCGCLVIAVNDFGRLTEAYGFQAAEEVVGAVAKRLRAKLRGADLLGRLSVNKFGVILKNCSADDLRIAAERLLTGVRDDVVQTSTGPIAVTVTIGGVNAPRFARTATDVLARAIEALGNAKSRRPGTFEAYAPNLELDALRRENARAGDEIVAALNDRRIVIAYEPVACAGSRLPVFFESLARVRRRDGTIAQAGEIVPVAERLGLVRLIDRRIMDLVVDQLIAEPDFVASLNVSAASTAEPDWWESLRARLRLQSNAAERLIIEITETAAIGSVDDARGFVRRVKDLGCRIAIDDFGAGYTSFRNLRKLGVDMIKIDGAFVQNIVRSQDDRAFVQTLIELAQRLGLLTVAEWVQDEETAAILSGWGCDYIQGALVGLASVDRVPTMVAGKSARRTA